MTDPNNNNNTNMKQADQFNRSGSQGSPPPTTAPPIPPISLTSLKPDQSQPRRGSFGFLRRQKSSDTARNMSSKKKGYQYPLPQSVPAAPPQLPQPTTFSAKDASFLGDDHRAQYGTAAEYGASTQGSRAPTSAPNSSSSPYGVPMPPIPASRQEDFDPYARTESMTHRGRHSYASSAFSVTGVNSPRRVRRRKDPTPFNILVVGSKNSGKTSFITFLSHALTAKSKNKHHENSSSPPQVSHTPMHSAFERHYLETEVDNERIGVSIWDSEGLEKNIVDLQLRKMSTFLEGKFEETFTEEQKVIRAPGAKDTHIHCVFLILDPSRLDTNLAQHRDQTTTRLQGILDEEFDLLVLRALQGQTAVIPVISKADTITTRHMATLKVKVWQSLQQANLNPLQDLELDDSDSLDERDEDDLDDSRPASINIDQMLHELERPSSHNQSSLTNPADAHKSAAANEPSVFPMSIISPDMDEPVVGRKDDDELVYGRKFPWGFADPYNEDHCDFVRLKESVFTSWRAALREASRDIWYEQWRTSRLNRRTGSGVPAAATKKPANGSAGNSNGRRNVSANTPSNKQYPGSSPYSGGPVGQAASSTPNVYTGAYANGQNPPQEQQASSYSQPVPQMLQIHPMKALQQQQNIISSQSSQQQQMSQSQSQPQASSSSQPSGDYRHGVNDL